MNVAILKYNAGNIESVRIALNRLGLNPIITDDIELLINSDKVIFPGVGEASSAMKYLRERKLDKVIKNLKQPVLGICLGMQLLCQYSEENQTECLGVLPSTVRKFASDNLKIPHIGWNNVSNLKGQLFQDVPESSYFYFVHGYFVEIGTETAAICDYGLNFTAAIEHQNFYATQFHPEKSGEMGAKLLENFLQI